MTTQHRRLAFRVARHKLAVGYGFCFVGVEGAEDRAFCRGGRFRVVDCVDEEGEAEDVGEEDEFLPSFTPYQHSSAL